CDVVFLKPECIRHCRRHFLHFRHSRVPQHLTHPIGRLPLPPESSKRNNASYNCMPVDGRSEFGTVQSQVWEAGLHSSPLARSNSLNTIQAALPQTTRIATKTINASIIVG